MIVVLDSGVWISAFHFGGVPRQALGFAATRCSIALSQPIRDEIDRILQKKFRWSKQSINDVFGAFASRVMTVDTPGALHGVCRDPNDDMVVECAVVASAELIVSGDKDLLSMKRYKSIRIVSARAFLRAIDTE